MSYAAGVGWALLAAIAHSAIDVLRKLGSQRMAPADLIALVTVYDGVIATIGVLCVDQGLPDTSTFDKHTFYTVVAITAFGATFARLLYQRALSIAPLSLTVPYLAFTPAFVVLISPLFLAGEAASPMGMLGVFVVSLSGYLLGVVTAPNSSSQQQPCSPSKLKLPVMASTGRPSWSGGPQKQQQQLQHQHHITLPQQHQQLTIAPANGATPDDWREQQHMTTHDHAVAAADADSTSSKGKSSGGGKSKGNQSSVWAMAYYKHKTAHGTGLPVAPMQLLAAAAPSLPWSSTSNSSSPHGSSSHLAGASTANGSAKDSGSSSSSSWDSQAKASKEKPGRPAVRVARLLQEPARHRNSCIRQLSVRWSAAMSSPKAAPAMVLTAAFLYSITASLDKVGIEAAQYSLSAYFLAQRVLMGGGGVSVPANMRAGALRHVVRDSLLLFSISLVEQGSVVVYLLAIENILVSYVVAIKRVNVLLSTLIGCVLFKEQVGKRIPYIMLMLCGMLLIVLQPGHEDLHHSHHTRHHHMLL